MAAGSGVKVGGWKSLTGFTVIRENTEGEYSGIEHEVSLASAQRSVENQIQ